MVLAHSLRLSLPLIKFAPKCSREDFSLVPTSSSLAGGIHPGIHYWNCHGLAGSDIKLSSLGSKLSLQIGKAGIRSLDTSFLLCHQGSIIGFVNRGNQGQTAGQESLSCGLLVGRLRLP